jgi:hypothetical protein
MREELMRGMKTLALLSIGSLAVTASVAMLHAQSAPEGASA